MPITQTSTGQHPKTQAIPEDLNVSLDTFPPTYSTLSSSCIRPTNWKLEMPPEQPLGRPRHELETSAL